MSTRLDKNLIISYTLLVGMPLLGVVGVLGAARGLGAPISVAGSWDLRVDPSTIEAGSCLDALRVRHGITFDISQSGKYLTLAINTQQKVGFRGMLEGKAIAASSNGPVDVGCKDSSPLSFTAEIDATAVPRALSGVLSFSGCPSCGTVNFRAVRQASPKE